MSRVTYANTPTTAEQDALRTSRGLRVVSAAEEGSGVNVLPGGVFGYTYSPGLLNAPLFAVKRYRNYETQKLADGTVLLVGFADPATAEKVTSGGAESLRIQPEPDDQANVLVQIPYDRIQHHRQYAAPNEHGFTVTLLPRE